MVLFIPFVGWLCFAVGNGKALEATHHSEQPPAPSQFKVTTPLQAGAQRGLPEHVQRYEQCRFQVLPNPCFKYVMQLFTFYVITMHWSVITWFSGISLDFSAMYIQFRFFLSSWAAQQAENPNDVSSPYKVVVANIVWSPPSTEEFDF